MVATETPVVFVDNVHAGYLPGVNILNGCSLVANQGELIGIIGPNGAGKSTLLKAIFGQVNVREGSITLEGDDITGLRANKLVARGVGFIPQTNNVFPTLTIEENLQMGLYQRPSAYKERLEFVTGIFAELGKRLKQRAGSLSGGERQMVAMSRALMMDPKVLLLDEPSAGLSPVRQDEAFIRVSEINKAGVTCIMVEQNARRRSNRRTVRPGSEPLKHADDDPAERRRVGEDVRRYRTDAGVAEGGQSQVPSAVRHLRFPTAMMGTTVALDNEPALDHEVHSTDPVDPQLALEPQTESTKQESHERLGAGFTLAIDQGPKCAAAARHQPEQFVESVLVDQAQMQSTVERRDRCARRLADHGLQERVEDLHAQRARGRSTVQRGPVQSDPRRRPQPGRAREPGCARSASPERRLRIRPAGPYTPPGRRIAQRSPPRPRKRDADRCPAALAGCHRCAPIG
jgi:branched-chain amino acid transport system ATP-binding protein